MTTLEEDIDDSGERTELIAETAGEDLEEEEEEEDTTGE